MCLITADNIIKTVCCQINHSTEEFKLRLPMTKNLDLKILKSRTPGYCDIALKIVHLRNYQTADVMVHTVKVTVVPTMMWFLIGVGRRWDVDF